MYDGDDLVLFFIIGILVGLGIVMLLVAILPPVNVASVLEYIGHVMDTGECIENLDVLTKDARETVLRFVIERDMCTTGR